MKRLHAPLITATLLTALLAGCAGDDGGPSQLIPAATDAISFGSGSAGIRGQVTNPELSPVAGAVVTLEGYDPLRTDEAGQFEVVGLTEGTLKMTVEADGYAPGSRDIKLAPGAFAEVQFVLEWVPGKEPYIQTLPFRGTSECDYMLLVFTGRLSGCAAADNQFPVELLEGWEFVIVEQSWQSTTTTSEWFRVFTADDGDCTNGSPCYGLVYADGYARIEGEPGVKSEMVEHYDPWGDGRGPPYPANNETTQMFVNSQWIGLLVEETNSAPGDPCQAILQAATGTTYKRGCVGWGLSTGVKFDMWVSLFMHRPPQDLGPCCPASQYTALPDG